MTKVSRIFIVLLEDKLITEYVKDYKESVRSVLEEISNY